MPPAVSSTTTAPSLTSRSLPSASSVWRSVSLRRALEVASIVVSTTRSPSLLPTKSGKRLRHPIDGIRISRLVAEGAEPQGLLRRRRSASALREESGLDHVVEHHVDAGACQLDIARRRITRRRLEQAGKQRRLRRASPTAPSVRNSAAPQPRRRRCRRRNRPGSDRARGSRPW